MQEDVQEVFFSLNLDAIEMKYSRYNYLDVHIMNEMSRKHIHFTCCEF